jgi:hypothetical protein
MEEAEDEPLFCERAAGIDIGRQSVMVTIRVASETRKGGRRQESREFGTTRRQLLEIADWLRCWGVERAGMEATSDYWKPRGSPSCASPGSGRSPSWTRSPASGSPPPGS